MKISKSQEIDFVFLFCCVVVTSVAICFWLLSFQLGGINGETSEGPLPTLFSPPLSSSSEVHLNLLSQFMVWLSKVQPGCLDKLFQSQKRKGRAAWHGTRGVLHVNNIYLFIVLCLFYFCTAFLTFPLLLFFQIAALFLQIVLIFFFFLFMLYTCCKDKYVSVAVTQRSPSASASTSSLHLLMSHETPMCLCVCTGGLVYLSAATAPPPQ